MVIFSFDQSLAIATLVATIVVGLITVSAIAFSPIIALRIQKAEEDNKDIKQKQLNIFKALMATQAARVSPEHCYALNMIDIEFYGCKNVLSSWATYKAHLNSMTSEQTDEAAKVWLKTGNDLLMNLLSDISKHLNLYINKEDLNGLYFPRAQGEYENDKYLIRKGVLEVINGIKTISINVKSRPGAEESQSK